MAVSANKYNSGAQKQLKSPNAERGKGGFSPTAFRGSSVPSFWTYDLQNCERINVSVVLSHHVCYNVLM